MNFVRISMMVAALLASLGIAGWQGGTDSSNLAPGSDTLDGQIYDVGGTSSDRQGGVRFTCNACG